MRVLCKHVLQVCSIFFIYLERNILYSSLEICVRHGNFNKNEELEQRSRKKYTQQHRQTDETRIKREGREVKGLRSWLLISIKLRQHKQGMDVVFKPWLSIKMDREIDGKIGKVGEKSVGTEGILID